METRTDEQLMLAFAAGEESAFDELFLRHWNKLRAFFLRRVEERSRAEELAQDTFLVVFRGARLYEPRALFRTYLYAIAFRVLRAERRRATLRALLFLPARGAEPASSPANEEQALSVREVLGRLGARDREVVMLREYEQLSYVEIAALLNVPVNTIRSRLFRARQALRKSWLSEKTDGFRAKARAPEGEI